MPGVCMFTAGAIWVGSRWAGQTGGVVAVVVAGVAGGAGLSLPHCRQLHSPCDVLQTDLWLHPTIQHLRLHPAKPQKSLKYSTMLHKAINDRGNNHHSYSALSEIKTGQGHGWVPRKLIQDQMTCKALTKLFIIPFLITLCNFSIQLTKHSS